MRNKILTILIMAMFAYACGSPDSSKPEMSIEYKLATIDKGYVSEDDITITRFRSLLRQLDAKYADNKQEIADSTVVAQRILKNDYGIREILLNIMEGLNLVAPTKANPSYAEYATAYCILRGKGLSYQRAVAGIEAYLKSIGRWQPR